MLAIAVEEVRMEMLALLFTTTVNPSTSSAESD